MKRILLFLLLLSALNPLFARKVVFRVDMTGKTISPNGVHLAGNFQNTDYSGANENDLLLSWNPSAYLMSNGGSGNIYSITLDMSADLVYEYKIINNNNWTNVEQVPVACQVGGGNDNRWVYIPAGTDTLTLPAIQFGGFAPIGKSLLNMSVDMTSESLIDASGVHVAGNFQGWNPSANKMVNYTGSGTFNAKKYLALLYVDNNSSIEFKFINGNSLSKIENVPSACSVNGNRAINNINGTVFYDVAYGKCLASFGAQTTRKVLFRVDMTGKTISANGVHIAGNFQNTDYAGVAENPTLLSWDPTAYQMTYTGVGNIYAVCLELKSDLVYEYKIINDNAWTDVEVIPVLCQVGGTNDNRWVYIPAGSDTLVLPALKYGGYAENGKSLLNLEVNLSNQTSINAEGVHVTGNFQGWNTSASKMVNYSGSGTFNASNYRVLVYIDSNATAQFKFINGNSSNQFETVPVSCAINGNRLIPSITGAMQKIYVFGACSEFLLESSAGNNGTINPTGVFSANPGTNQTYTIVPDAGYSIDSLIINGAKVSATNTYSFNNIISNQSIKVTFKSMAAALAAANICANDTIVSTVNLPAQSNVKATTYYSNIYLFNQNNTNNAYKYNVNERKYTAIADKPTPCIACGVAEARGKVYCFNSDGTTEAFDIASNSWLSQANLPSGTSASVNAVSINNKVYVLGGNANQNSFYFFNPDSNSYTALSSPNTATGESRLVVFNNKIYKIGGADHANQAISTVEVYNPTNNTWTAMPDLPEALSQVGATHYNNKLYVFGGKQNSNTNSNKVYVFEFTSNAWYVQNNSLSFSRTNIEAKTANNMVFLFSGSDIGSTPSNQAFRYFCKDQLCTCKWAEYVCNGVSSDVPCPINAMSLYNPGTVFCNGNTTKVVDVTNPVTGKTWMDRNLGASRVAMNSTDSLSYGDLYQWGRGADGHQCRNSVTTSSLSTTDQPNNASFVIANYPFDWLSIQNDNLWQGLSGINNPCPLNYRLPSINELEEERASWSQNNLAGAFQSPLKLTATGIRTGTNGVLPYIYKGIGFYWSNNVTSNYSWYLRIESGNSYKHANVRSDASAIRCIKDNTQTFFNIDTVGSINNGTLTSGLAANIVGTTLNYTNGRGLNYNAQILSSTGVTGLTAILDAGTLKNGNGTITLTISGTPNSAGMASFTISIGGKLCTFTRNVLPVVKYPTNSVFCNGIQTAVIDVTNPITGKTWMDRNLGASRAATSIADTLAYGDLYQWGRGADGHQCRNSVITTTLSTADQPGHGNFILAPTAPNNWRSFQNDNLWQGLNGVNNPCPSAYRLPTQIELDAERMTWSQNNQMGAFGSSLKFSAPGFRAYTNGALSAMGAMGIYLSSNTAGSYLKSLFINNSTSQVGFELRSCGFTVRCIKEVVNTIGGIDTVDASKRGVLYSSVAASNVSTTLNYTNGNGLSYATQSVSSSGVSGLTATLAAGTLNNGNGSITINISGIPSTSGFASFTISIGGKTVTFTINVLVSVSVDTKDAVYSGLLYAGTAASNVSTTLNYTNGNSQSYAAQSVNSTGVTGLTATLAAGTLNSGSGSITLTISGIPSTSGTATFTISLGGKIFTFTMNVTLPTSINTSGAIHSGGLYSGAAASNVSTTLNYTYGNSQSYQAQSVSSTGVTGLTATLAAGTLNSGSGSITITITGTPNATGTASFTFTIGGKTFTFTINVVVPIVIDANTALKNGVLYSGSAASNVSTIFNYTNGSGQAYAAQSANSSGVTGLTATINAGTLNSGNGTITVTITGTPSASGTASFTITIGGKTITFSITVYAPITINTNNAVNNGVLNPGVAASNVSTTFNYTNGGGQTFLAQSVSSTGITGLTANLAAGTLANGSGSITITISGIPIASGIASFTLMIGGNTFTFTINVVSATNNATFSSNTVSCNGTATAVLDVYNPVTGKIWMDRNLGATRAATSSTDAAAYGDLYQWGRGADGHQCRNSGKTTNLSTVDQPNHANFITCVSVDNYYDWRNPSNDNLWQGPNGINNPCPNGYRLPTYLELVAEKASWSQQNSIGAFNSPLKFPMAGSRDFISGTVAYEGIAANYWSSSVYGLNFQSNTLFFDLNSFANIGGTYRTYGFSVRCIKQSLFNIDTVGAIKYGVLYSGAVASGVMIKLKYTNENAGQTYQAQNVSSIGVNGLTAYLGANSLDNGNGTVSITILGTPSATGIASFTMTINGKSITFTFNVEAPVNLDTNNPINNGTLNSAVAASNVSTTLNYTNGNGQAYTAQTSSSTGVTGLTANLAAGTFNSGNGTVTLTITGTPSNSGTASFSITIGGKTITLTRNVIAATNNGTFPANTVFCNGTATAIVDVTNPLTGKTWMDRNLGASRVATSSTDAAAYGDLYQWGRTADGHQCRNSVTTSNLSSTDQPNHSNFILAPNNSSNDWRNPQNTNLWQGVNGMNNPCPLGYRIPTINELDAERTSWSLNYSTGAFNSPLKFPMSGYRYYNSGSLNIVGMGGVYWSSSADSGYSKILYINNGTAFTSNYERAYGFSVRCIKD